MQGGPQTGRDLDGASPPVSYPHHSARAQHYREERYHEDNQPSFSRRQWGTVGRKTGLPGQASLHQACAQPKGRHSCSRGTSRCLGFALTLRTPCMASTQTTLIARVRAVSNGGLLCNAIETCFSPISSTCSTQCLVRLLNLSKDKDIVVQGRKPSWKLDQVREAFSPLSNVFENTADSYCRL